MVTMLESVRLWFEHFFLLPIRWYRSHIHVWREARQRCKACGQTDGFNFTVPDDIWEAVVPPRLIGRVVCLRCFDRFAKEREVDYSTSVSEFLFAGDKACFNWDLNSSVNIRDCSGLP